MQGIGVGVVLGAGWLMLDLLHRWALGEGVPSRSLSDAFVLVLLPVCLVMLHVGRKAYHGEKVRLPVLAKLADRHA